MIERELPSGWRLEPLGHLANFVNGAAFKPDDWHGEGQPIIRIQNLTNPDREPNLTRRIVDKKYEVVPGDLLVSWSATLDIFEWSGPVAWLNQHIFKVADVRPDIHKPYLRHLLANEIEALRNGAHFRGATMAHINRGPFLAHLVPVPPLTEQRRIADRLDEAMVEIDTVRAALNQQDDSCICLRFALINEVLGGRAVSTNDPADQPGDGWVALASVARLESGHTPSRKRPEWWGGDVPWIALPDIRALDGTTAEVTSETTNELGLANSSARLLPEGTVVLSRTASVGFVTVLGKPMATSQDFVNWVPGPKLRSWYLAYALIGARNYLRDLSSGAVHKTIYMPTLKSLHIRLPSLREQDGMVERIQSAHSIADETQKYVATQSIALGALPASLLSAAFRGEL